MFEDKQSPTFLGIGTMKSGSTWLHHLLSSHQHIWMPEKRIEIHFFNRNYNHGIDWYAQFFPPESQEYLQIGEYTPHYIHSKQALQRIKKFEGINKFIISYRNPVERAFSHYKWYKRNYPLYKGSFKDFVLEDNPDSVELGFYAKELERFLSLFSKDSLLILIFEEMVSKPENTKKKLAQFLEIDPLLFPKDAGHKTHNKSFTPKYGLLYYIARRIGKTMRSLKLGKLGKFLKRLPITDFVYTPGKAYKATNEDLLMKKRLYERFDPDIKKLQELTGYDFKRWQKQKENLLAQVSEI